MQILHSPYRFRAYSPRITAGMLLEVPLEQMTTPGQILVAYDFSKPSELALQHALNLALEDTERDFHFLVVLDPSKGLGLKKNETVDFKYAEEVHEITQQRIANVFNKLDRGGQVNMLVHVRIGDPLKVILTLAREVGAHLIVLGSHGRTGAKRLLLGSVSERVVREALCPVLVTRERGYQDVKRLEIIEVEKDDEEYVSARPFHYNSGGPMRPKAWSLY